MSRRSRTPWTHELVGGASGSYPRGSCQMRRQRVRGPNERARDAGGVLGMCGAARRGHGRGGEGAAGVKCGRRVGGGRCTRAGSAQHAGGVAARARGRVWGGLRAPWRRRSRTPCPVDVDENLKRKSAPEFGARATALTPQTGAPSQALELPWPLHRLRPQRQRATAGRLIWARPPQRHSRERRGPEYARARGQRARTFCVRAPQPLRASSAPGLKLSARDLRA